MSTERIEQEAERVTVADVAEALGEGWEGFPYHGMGQDGTLRGPGGEVLDVDFRNIRGEGLKAYLRRRVHEGEGFSLEVPMAAATSGAVGAQIAEAYPQIAEAHGADQERLAALMEPARVFAAEVAEHLGPEWSGGAVDRGNRDEANVRASVASGEYRVEWTWYVKVYGRWPEPSRFEVPPRWELSGVLEGEADSDNWRRNPRISVASKRPAKQIAGEIRRRVLPGYTEAVAGAKQANAEHAEAVARADEYEDRIRAALGPIGARYHVNAARTPRRDLSFYGEEIRAKVGLSGWPSGSVSVELSGLTVERAEAVLRIAAEGDAAHDDGCNELPTGLE